ncbi:hypothetical protein TELCIR_16674 [Teladorsagia circumcincta]|uniref:Uncharacterized protein n=1 Tax=Teladorsagia circumcincta TaxID=45464 RepID=A0A2G9TX09_TELCI|nr:hypothetical protein TELCIR_16674 [Teladorsagia circumcincta]
MLSMMTNTNCSYCSRKDKKRETASSQKPLAKPMSHRAVRTDRIDERVIFECSMSAYHRNKSEKDVSYCNVFETQGEYHGDDL